MKINFLGDSITEGAIAGNLENRYSTLVAKYFDAEECNFGVGGTNGYGHGDAKLGCFEDGEDYTFYGAFHNLVAYLVSVFPKNKLCFILPIPRFDQENPYGDGSKAEPMPPMSTYIEAEKKGENLPFV